MANPDVVGVSCVHVMALSFSSYQIGHLCVFPSDEKSNLVSVARPFHREERLRDVPSSRAACSFEYPYYALSAPYSTYLSNARCADSPGFAALRMEIILRSCY